MKPSTVCKIVPFNNGIWIKHSALPKLAKLSYLSMSFFADDIVGTALSGRLYTKREFIDYTKTNPPGLACNKFNDMKIRFFGNIAVAQGSETSMQKDRKTNLIVWADISELRDGQCSSSKLYAGKVVSRLSSTGPATVKW